MCCQFITYIAQTLHDYCMEYLHLIWRFFQEENALNARGRLPPPHLVLDHLPLQARFGLRQIQSDPDFEIPTPPPPPYVRFCPVHSRCGLSDGEASRGPACSRSRGSRRDDPRRHTLGGNHGHFINPHLAGQMQRDDEIEQLETEC